MNNLLRRSELFFKKNGATILTCMGGAGVVATSIMAVKATPKALKLVEEAKEEKGEDLTKLEIVRVAGSAYIPAILIGASTIACIFGANVLNKRQQAAIASAYALLDSSYKEYKNKVVELYGKDADKEVKAKIAKDHYKNEDLSELDFGEDKELFYDYFSERYFEATMEDVVKAQYELNRQIAVDSGAYLNEYYEFLGLDKTIEGNELGWSQGILEAMYWVNWVDFDHSKVEMDDGLECTIITMRQEPVIDFSYY